MPVHHAAEQGYHHGAAAYANGRPDYPPEVSVWLKDTLGIAPGGTVLDLGAGTGKFTPLLLETGAEVIAVEPVAAMRERMAADHPGVQALVGTATAIPLSDASLDAVVCAQAFHWFAEPAALAEIRRVLKPGGSLGLIWNVRDEKVEWVAELSCMTDPWQGDAPRYRTGTWHTLFPAPGFTPLKETHFHHAHGGDPEDVIVRRTLSVSFIAALSVVEQDAIAAEVRGLIAATPALAGQPRVAFPYEVAAFACRRTG